MYTEEAARECIKNCWGIAEGKNRELFIRFGLQDLPAVPPLLIFAHLNWGEQVYEEVADRASADEILAAVDRLTDKFMETWWGTLLEREAKNPAQTPKQYPWPRWDRRWRDD
jgi:hypothetical protein